MIPFKRGNKARLKHFGFVGDSEPKNGDYLVVGVTPQRVKIDVGNEVITLAVHNASKWQWAGEVGAAMMYTALA